jgi:hypothetical protein
LLRKEMGKLGEKWAAYFSFPLPPPPQRNSLHSTSLSQSRPFYVAQRPTTKRSFSKTMHSNLQQFRFGEAF